MKTWLILLLFPLTVAAISPAGKRLNLKLAPQTDDDAKRLQQQSKEPVSPVKKDKAIAIDCVDGAGITHKPEDPGWERCTEGMPSPAMSGSKRAYETAPKNSLSPSNVRTVQGANEIPSVQTKP